MSRNKVDILVLRTVKCDEDSRVGKILHHYAKLRIKVGVTCISRGEECKRISTDLINHQSVRFGRNFSLISASTSLRRFVLRFQLFIFLLHARKWKPTVLHGCDLDGYLVARFAFPGRKTIFEVYDPWTTMTDSKRAAKLEAKAFIKSDVLIMPAKDSRIKVKRDKQIALGNVLDISLSNRLLTESTLNPEIKDLISSDTKYILSGGILGKSVATDLLIEAIAKSYTGVQLIIASDLSGGIEANPELDFSNVHFIGKQTWSNWLTLMRSADAVWIYYDAKEDHFKSHISPNKYWEASLFNVPMLINDINQFCDRTHLESIYFELGSEPQNRIEEALKFVNEVQPKAVTSDDIEAWINIENERTSEIKQVLTWVGLISKSIA